MKIEMDEPLLKKFKVDIENIVEINEFFCNKLNKKKEENSNLHDINKNKEKEKGTCKKESNDCLSNNEDTIKIATTSSNLNMVIYKEQKSSPKKRLDYKTPNQFKPKLFNYGNYSRYYGYRNEKDFQDVRLNVFVKHKNLFEGNEILDIGCNSGLITMRLAENISIKHITGIDIDKSLINKVTKFIEKKRRNTIGNVKDKSVFPFNIKFIHGNYVLRDDVLLEIEREQFNLILCLSVTKWIHLNFGDKAIKQAFKRMFLQIRSGGYLILEPQPWNSYKRRKNLTPEINEIYKGIKFRPDHFTDYLLGPEVGFSEMKILDTPEHPSKGFRRPLQLFYKK